MAEERALSSVGGSPRQWYGIRETAEMLGVTRQTLHERVQKLQGARKVDGQWRIPGETVEALLAAERAKALASGVVIALPAPSGDRHPGDALGDLVARITDLERTVAEQARSFKQQLADRDTTIDELRADRRRLRQALGTVTKGLEQLVAGDGRDDPASPG